LPASAVKARNKQAIGKAGAQALAGLFRGRA